MPPKRKSRRKHVHERHPAALAVDPPGMLESGLAASSEALIAAVNQFAAAGTPMVRIDEHLPYGTAI